MVALMAGFFMLTGATAAALLLSGRWVIAWFAWPPLLFAATDIWYWLDPPRYPQEAPHMLFGFLESTIAAGYLGTMFIVWISYAVIQSRSADVERSSSASGNGEQNQG